MSRCWTEAELEDYLDGELAAEARLRLERHLDSCESCRRALVERERLAEAVGRLPRELDPPRDLWGGIADGIDAERRDAGDSGASRPPAPGAPRRLAFGWAVAAVVVISLGVVVYGLLAKQPGGGSDGGLSTAQAGSFGGQPLLVSRGRADAQLTAMADELEHGFEARQQTLAPSTRATIERNLALLDAAIRLSREALEKDRTDYQAAAVLREMQRKKIKLLELANELPYPL